MQRYFYRVITAIVVTLAALNVYASSKSEEAGVVGSPRLILEYPAEAKEKCIEGWVIVSFTVQPSGKISEIKIVEEESLGYFAESALNEIKKLSYPIHEGGPVEDVRVKLAYKLSDSDLTACKP